MPKRKVCVITGTRAEYGLLKPVMNKIISSKSLTLQIIATGMHLLPEFGSTVEEIKNDGFKIDARVPIVVGGDDKLSMSMSIGLGIIAISQSLETLNPDLVVVLGDRFEIFAASIAAVYSGRVLAHLCGGDSPEGGYDEYTRHSITKIAHLHFPMTEKSANRIIKMGENPKNVHVVGYTSLDTILNKELPNKIELSKKYNLTLDKPLVLVTHHPISTIPNEVQFEVQSILDVIVELQLNCLISFPNVDPGGKRILNVIKKFAESYPSLIQVYNTIPYEDYLGLMKIADVMVGNSSSGILEAPAFNLPFINVGKRQQGRERANNVIDVEATREDVKKGIEKALYDAKFLDEIRKGMNPFGDGRASERIVNILEKVKIDKELIKKRFFEESS
ncbi:MAG: UDP-N-acetylglucosamine 2-epimerase [Promethearchaeota archaeon]